MINLDLLELGDCFTPEELVNEIFRQNPDLPLPIPVENIAKSTGILDIQAIRTDDVEGMLVADEGKDCGVIYYKESSPLGRQRFTIGHELGHFLLLHHNGRQSCLPNDIRIGGGSNINQLEQEANLFSQMLLMPDSHITGFINGCRPDLNLLKNISDSFVMSFEAIANKCASISSWPFALIYSKDKVVRYAWKDHKLFPFWLPLKRGDRLPSISQAARLNQPNLTISNEEEVIASTWLSSGRYGQLPRRLIEQTFTQENNYQVTMLRIDL